MENQNTQHNPLLLAVLSVVYVAAIAAFSYANWAADPASMDLWMTALNALLLSVPLVVLLGSIYVLALAWQEHKATGQVNPSLARVIHWGPRVAAILIIFFISLFSLDVFEMEASPLELLGGLLMHNIPSLALLVLLLFSWKRPAVGFWAFLAGGILFAIFFVRSIYALTNLLMFVFPILVIAGLFYADWKWVKT
jgi:hypothetical protein